MRGSALSRYEQFDTSPKTVEQEQFANSDRFKENYSIDMILGKRAASCITNIGTARCSLKQAEQIYKVYVTLYNVFPPYISQPLASKKQNIFLIVVNVLPNGWLEFYFVKFFLDF